jgi:hypothetical protein
VRLPIRRQLRGVSAVLALSFAAGNPPLERQALKIALKDERARQVPTLLRPGVVTLTPTPLQN